MRAIDIYFLEKNA